MQLEHKMYELTQCNDKIYKYLLKQETDDRWISKPYKNIFSEKLKEIKLFWAQFLQTTYQLMQQVMLVIQL